MDLGGTWRAAAADEALPRSAVGPDADDHDWHTVAVPGHWRASPGLADAAGPVLYRRRFDAPPPLDGERAWLVFDGLCYQGDIWLDGTYLGDTEGWFGRHTFEVTRELQRPFEHVLAVEVLEGGSPLLGTLASAGNGGIWRPVHLDRTGPVRARDLRVLCSEATDARAVLTFRAELDSDTARSVELHTTVGGTAQVDERPVAEGSNFVTWSVGIDDPDRWWPHALGSQPLHDLGVEVRVDGVVSHVLHRRVGLRAVAWQDRVLRVNGERLFAKGSTIDPPPGRLGDPPASWWRDRVAAARDAGLDLLRVRGFVAPPPFYEAADELGVLVWQDLPLVGRVARRATAQAVRQAEAMVDILGHHAAVAIWCGHDQPARSQLLDRSVRRALSAADATRPVVTHAEPPRWVERDVAAVARAVPRAVRFPTSLPPDRRRIEALRRLKYRPTGGFCLAADDEETLLACAPVLVVADPFPSTVAPGAALALDVHVISDRRVPIEAATLTAQLAWRGGERCWTWKGAVPADDVVRVATLPIVVPDRPGELVLDLRVEAAGVVATNRYRTTID